jgi:hypothetical protein
MFSCCLGLVCVGFMLGWIVYREFWMGGYLLGEIIVVRYSFFVIIHYCHRIFFVHCHSSLLSKILNSNPTSRYYLPRPSSDNLQVPHSILPPQNISITRRKIHRVYRRPKCQIVYLKQIVQRRGIYILGSSGLNSIERSHGERKDGAVNTLSFPCLSPL